MIKIYHNPKCSKSRNALKYLTDKGIEPQIILYLNKEKYTAETLTSLAEKMGLKPSQMVRTQEDLYKNEYKEKNISENQWIKILIENPNLIIRPIIENGNKAIFGNPVENIDKIFD